MDPSTSFWTNLAMPRRVSEDVGSSAARAVGGAETDAAAAAARTPGARSAARRGTSPSDEEVEEEEAGVARVGARGRRVSPFDRRAENARTRAVVVAGADMAAPSALVVDATGPGTADG